MNYHIILKFGDIELPVTESNLRELTIVQDINKFLPEFRLKINDSTGYITHVTPFDSRMSKVRIELADTPESKDKNAFDFAVFRRMPEGNQSTPASLYDIEGLLDSEGLFSPDRCRGLSGSIRSSLSRVSTEMKIDSTEISPSLEYEKVLVQPLWSNIQFLKYLKENLIGKSDEYGFKCFIKRYNARSVFVFRGLREFINDPVAYKFLLSDREQKGQNPIYSFSIYDNYKIHEIFASKKQAYKYFNYTLSEFVEGNYPASDFMSLSDYFLIDANDSEDSNCIDNTGRSNDFTADFKGKVKSSFSNRLNNLVNMWILSKGLANACPGQIVSVLFPHGAVADELYSYQYSGYWMISKVVHNIGSEFMTRLLLTRNGLDTDKNTTLLKATTRKRV